MKGKKLPSHLRSTILEMLYDLSVNQLIVTKIPSIYKDQAIRGAGIRSVESRNPLWYREICAKYLSNRKKPRKKQLLDTRIKRKNILNILERLGNNKTTISYLYNDLLNTALKQYDIPF